jgi:hypothetical protein
MKVRMYGRCWILVDTRKGIRSYPEIMKNQRQGRNLSRSSRLTTDLAPRCCPAEFTKFS